MVRLAAARPTIANSGLLQEPQRFCSRDHSCSRPHALHSRRVKNMGAMERTSMGSAPADRNGSQAALPDVDVSCQLAGSTYWQHVGARETGSLSSEKHRL